MIAPMLPSVDPLSTSVIAAPSTSASCAETASRQASVSLRPFQLTMMTSTAIRTCLRCGVSAAPGSTPDVRESACAPRTRLCSHRSGGRGKTSEALELLKGKIWQKLIDKEELPQYRERYKIISTKVIDGKIMAHVLADSSPGNDFTVVEPDLEDVYFSYINTK